MAKFDPSKPHGLVCGELDGRHYEQGGRFFRSNGDPWSEGDAIRVAADGGDTESDTDVTQTPEFKAAVAAAVADAIAKHAGGQRPVVATEADTEPKSKVIGKTTDRLGPTDKNLKG